jgi:hypothetical protein
LDGLHQALPDAIRMQGRQHEHLREDARKGAASHCVRKSGNKHGEYDGSGWPTGFSNANAAQEEDQKCDEAKDEKQRGANERNSNQLKDADDQAYPEALLAEVVYIPGIFDRWPEDALQPAVSALVLRGEPESLHCGRFAAKYLRSQVKSRLFKAVSIRVSVITPD